MAHYVKGTFTWRWRSASRPCRPLPEDFNVLCPCFSLAEAEAEAVAAELELPEIVQATFYAMLLNDKLELGAVHEYTAEKMSGDFHEGQVGPQVEGWHPQFYNLPALIDVRVVAGVPQKNKCRESKKIPYTVALFEPGTPSRSSCKYSSTPSILSPEVEGTYPWEITIANYVPDFQVRRMVNTKSTPRIQSPDELLAKGTLAPSQSNPEAKMASSSSSTSRSGSSDSASSHSWRSSSSEGTSTSSSPGSSLGSGSSVHK
ncbi:hypothetical protein Cgig2_021902 [Carnegiea gigantea]|uniref:Uncharacterized protein n=1 Tax=Carnegiea gigantea TaxID=171969 RepID=A0A9Q1JWJ0_9CARY|nr:hypothetical protein Cgig2_021902 [Carnegiea gigantea]